MKWYTTKNVLMEYEKVYLLKCLKILGLDIMIITQSNNSFLTVRVVEPWETVAVGWVSTSGGECGVWLGVLAGAFVDATRTVFCQPCNVDGETHADSDAQTQ